MRWVSLLKVMDRISITLTGKDVNQGDVDDNLKVFGVDKLRVIDSTIIPVMPDCRIQNAVYMIGEKVCIPHINWTCEWTSR